MTMVRPVELLDNLSKTPAAERVTQAQRTAAENDQRTAMMTVAQKAHEAKQRPEAAPQGDEVILHREPDENTSDRKKKKGQQDPADEPDSEGQSDPDKPGDDSHLAGHIDVTA
jgi:hypothetical protein